MLLLGLYKNKTRHLARSNFCRGTRYESFALNRFSNIGSCSLMRVQYGTFEFHLQIKLKTDCDNVPTVPRCPELPQHTNSVRLLIKEPKVDENHITAFVWFRYHDCAMSPRESFGQFLFTWFGIQDCTQARKFPLFMC